MKKELRDYIDRGFANSISDPNDIVWIMDFCEMPEVKELSGRVVAGIIAALIGREEDYDYDFDDADRIEKLIEYCEAE